MNLTFIALGKGNKLEVFNELNCFSNGFIEFQKALIAFLQYFDVWNSRHLQIHDKFV